MFSIKLLCILDHQLTYFCIYRRNQIKIKSNGYSQQMRGISVTSHFHSSGG